jgi:hypothetical protein
MSFTLQYSMQLFSSGVKVCTLLLKELLHLLLFICWTRTITQVHYLPFLFYNNDLPKIMKINSEPVLFADDTSLIITKPSPIQNRYHHCICSNE